MSAITKQLPFSAAPMRNNLIVIQAILVAVCVLGVWIYDDFSSAWAAIYGGAVALANAWLLARRIERAGELVKTDPNKGMYSLYIGAIQRFVLVLVGLGVGMGVFHLHPVPMIVTFGIAQLAYAIAAGRQASH